MFLVIPLVMCAAFGTANGAALVPPGAGNVNLLSLKSNFLNIIHQADIQINSQTIESTQPFINIQKHFQMLSEMSLNDLATVGNTLGFGDNIDNFRSAIYNGNSVAVNGNGFTNNKVFVPNTSVTNVAGNAVTAVVPQAPGHRYQTTCQAVQNTGCINDAITSKLSRYIDTTAAASSVNGIFGNILSIQQLQNEMKPYYTTNGNYMIWYDYAVIKLSTLFECLANIGLVRKFDCTLKLTLNTGTVGINVANNTAGLVTLGYSLTPANNTFINTCPIMVNYLNDTPANGGIPLTTRVIVAGLYVKAVPTTSVFNINLGQFTASSSLPACRIYYSQIQLDPQKASTYIENNTNKTVLYRSVLTNQYNNISGNFNQLINSGITHPVGILVVPFISSSVAGFGDYAWKSPFDSAPSTGHPISLTNFQVTVGGVNQLQSTLSYTYENFIEQINLAETLTSADFGISCGLFSQQYWETFRTYYVNVERSQLADKNVARNINISFTNNCSVAIDILVFTIYSDSFKINCETGLIQK